MCINRRFDYPCGHSSGGLLVHCAEYFRLTPAEQEARRKEGSHDCPKGPPSVEYVRRSGFKESVRGAIDEATKSLNKSMESLRLEKFRIGNFNLGELQFSSAGGCEICHKARESAIMLTKPKWGKLEKLMAIKNNCRVAVPGEDGFEDREKHQENACYLLDQVVMETELGQHIHYDPFGLTLPMILLSRPAARKNSENGIEGMSEPAEGHAEDAK